MINTIAQTMASYQALARTWRPRSFEQVVGQTTVLRILTNALTQNRPHHAYLLTGTRGVGKTSIARLLAKCLNCAKGVSANPCGECQPCLSIEQGTYLDLVEIDAASRTKVEDTRELLENVQYSPTQGHYKIYLIDEVHMLSNHSFNALLKTLEEPPEHVKFLLATTDPQKLPVTILSRCLQLHLKNLSAEQIITQLKHILESERFTYENNALHYIAHAAQGSMRDALSLLEQALGYGNGTVQTEDVKHMLGVTTPTLLFELLSSLLEKNATQMLSVIEQLSNLSVDFAYVLEEFLSLLHQIALLQAVPTLTKTPAPLRKEAALLVKNLTPEETQRYYQIALTGRRDLPLAPTPRSGFEMVLLKIFTFRSGPTTQAAPGAPEPAPAIPVSSPAAIQTSQPPIETHPNKTENDQDWANLIKKLDISAISLVVASHCVCIKQTSDTIHLMLDKQHAAMLNKQVEQRITDALAAYFKKTIQLTITIGEHGGETVVQAQERKTHEIKSRAITNIQEDAYLNALLDTFDAHIVPNSLKTKETP